MASALGNENRAGVFLYTTESDEFVRAYFHAERQWVMEAMPAMPEHEWEVYTKWVKSVTEPLPKKGRWRKLKAP